MVTASSGRSGMPRHMARRELLVLFEVGQRVED